MKISHIGYQNRVNRVIVVISEGIFEKYSKMKILVFRISEKGQILRLFSGLAPSKLKLFPKKLRVGYVCIEESFDIIFNMGYGVC